MKKILLSTMSITLILIFLLIFFTFYGHAVRHTEIQNALELSMKQAMEQLLLAEGKPADKTVWINDFAQSVAAQIESKSNLTIHLYEADLEKGLLSAEGILTFRNLIGSESSVTTGKRTILLEEYQISSHMIADINKNGITDTTEATTDISTYEQRLIKAGYGVIVDFGDQTYGVLMKGPDHTIDGKDGGELLIDALKEQGLQAGHIFGCWMNEDYYNWFAEDITESFPLS